MASLSFYGPSEPLIARGLRSVGADPPPAPPTETFLLAALVDYFDNHPDYTKTPLGVEFGSVAITYGSIQGDVHQATDWVHREVGVARGVGPQGLRVVLRAIPLSSICQGLLKSATVDNLEKYITKEVGVWQKWWVCPQSGG